MAQTLQEYGFGFEGLGSIGSIGLYVVVSGIRVEELVSAKTQERRCPSHKLRLLKQYKFMRIQTCMYVHIYIYVCINA